MPAVKLVQVYSRLLKNSSATAGDSTSLANSFARALPVALLLLSACSTTPQGRTHIVTPTPVSAVYSDADMRIQLATAPSINTPCVGVECEQNREFDQRVQQLGARLAVAAFDAYPDLNKRVSHFEFAVAEKADFGSTSNARGRVVIYRGMQNLDLEDAALAYLMARELGHVVGQHHDENSATRILLSVAIGVLFPALHLFSGTSTLAQATSATSATTVTSTVASTATSYLGSKVVLASIKPDQLSEADSIALGLLENLGWSRHDIATALQASSHLEGKSAWVEDFRVSVGRMKALDEEAEKAAFSLNAEEANLQTEQYALPETDTDETIETGTGAETVTSVQPEQIPGDENLLEPAATAAEPAQEIGKQADATPGDIQPEPDPAGSPKTPITSAVSTLTGGEEQGVKLVPAKELLTGASQVRKSKVPGQARKPMSRSDSTSASVSGKQKSAMKIQAGKGVKLKPGRDASKKIKVSPVQKLTQSPKKSGLKEKGV
jgi:Zn-dependent protease with chaperone function